MSAIFAPYVPTPNFFYFREVTRDKGKLTIRFTTKAVISCGTRIACAIRLAARLHPHKRINQRITRGRSRPDAKAGTVDIAPVTPLQPQPSDSVAACVHDGMVGHAILLKQRRKSVDVDLLILALVVLGIGSAGKLAGGLVPRVPSCNVGREAAELLGAAAILVSIGKLLRARLEVGIP